MGKNNFLIEKSWGALFKSLPDEKAGQIIKAMYDYDCGMEIRIEDPILSAVFEMIRSKMDENAEAYRVECEKRKIAQEQRWAKKYTEDDPTTCECDNDKKDNLYTSVYTSNKKDKQDTSVYASIHEYSDTSHNHIHNHTHSHSHNQSQSSNMDGIDTPKAIRDRETREVIDHMNAVCGTHFKADTLGTKKHISARLNEGFTVDDCKHVIDVKYAEWHNTDMAKYLRPQTLFNSEKFDGYLNQPVARSGTTDVLAEFMTGGDDG